MTLLIALVTVDAARELDEDLPPLVAAFTEHGFGVATPSWDDPAIDWSRYALTLLRSTWDYTDRLSEFLAWCERIAHLTTLCNPPALVRWNIDKRYALDLARAGVAIIPSAFFGPGERPDFPSSDEFVVKPSVGAGSRGARRFRANEHDAAMLHASQLQAAGFTVLVQPYLKSVDARGESALVYFDGIFSHCICKGPLLALDGSEVQGLFAREDISARDAAADEIALGGRAVAAIPGGAPLYARVDLIRDDAGAPRVLELELTEPSLFFNYAPGSADRYVTASQKRLGAGR